MLIYSNENDFVVNIYTGFVKDWQQISGSERIHFLLPFMYAIIEKMNYNNKKLLVSPSEEYYENVSMYPWNEIQDTPTPTADDTPTMATVGWRTAIEIHTIQAVSEIFRMTCNSQNISW